MGTYKCKIKGKEEFILIESMVDVADVVETLKSIYNASDILSIEKIVNDNDIPNNLIKLREKLKPFMWSKNGRGCTPDEMRYSDMRLEEIECPKCGRKSLQLLSYGDYYCENYRVECYDCEYTFPIEMNDCGECISEAKTQLGLYDFLNRPNYLLDFDLQLFLYKKVKDVKKHYEEMCKNDGYCYVNKENHKEILEILADI